MSTNDRLGGISFERFQESLKFFSQEDRERLEWLWGYYCNVLNKSKSALEQESGLRGGELRCLFDGVAMTRDQHDELMGAIDNMIRRVRKSKPLVRTVITERILDALDYCRDNSTMVYISGPTGRGKTYTAEYWAAQNNHGRTKLIRVPSDCTRRTLVTLLAKSCGISAQGSTADRELQLQRYFSPRNVIIIDEAGHLLGKSGWPGGPIELLRDLHDICKCGVALIFTDVYLNEMKRGKNADYFEQFLGRLEFPVEIPQVPRRDEVRGVIHAFIPDADETIVDFALTLARARDGKLRTLFKDLYRAEEFARSKSREMNLTDLQMMVKFRKSGGAWPEDR